MEQGRVGGARLNFLGEKASFLSQVVEWVLARSAEPGCADLSAWTLYFPVSRAARRFLELLVSEADSRSLLLTPPLCLSVGELATRLSPAPRYPFATALERDLAWWEALQSRDSSCFLSATAKERTGTLRNRLRAVGPLSSWWQEISAVGLNPQQALERLRKEASFLDDERWEELLALHEDYLRILDSRQRVDPFFHYLDSRTQPAVPSGKLVLVGCVELRPLLVQLLSSYREQSGLEVEALVNAPESMKAGFDGWGQLEPNYWQTKTGYEFQLVDDSRELVDQLETALSEHDHLDPQDLCVAVSSDGLRFAARQALQNLTIPLHDSQGISGAQAPLPRMLNSLAAWLQGRSYESLSELLRNPLLPAIHIGAAPIELIELLDDYYLRHVPRALYAPLLGKGAEPLIELLSALEKFALGIPMETASLQVTVQLLRERLSPWISLILGLHRGREAYESLRRALDELSLIGESWELSLTFVEALTVLAEMVSEDPLVEDASQASSELLGWLELALDDAPCVTILGLNEEWIPETINGDALLPNSVRLSLGLSNNELRFARDAYVLFAATRSRRWVKLFALRKNLSGDSALPSRLLLPDNSETVAQVYQTLASGEPKLLMGSSSAFSAIPRPRTDAELPISFSVSQLESYLRCPYRFYLEHIERIRPVDDSQRELDAAQVGSLMHQVLAIFGRANCRNSVVENEIREFFADTVEQLFADQFGTHARVSLRFQKENLIARLWRMASWQADHARAGWMIDAVEQPLERRVRVGNETVLLRGRIDRIDRHPAERASLIIDYKSGNLRARSAHFRADGSVVGLQLPVYQRLFSSGVAAATTVDTAYVHISQRIDERIEDRGGFNEQELDAAWSCAESCLKRILQREFWPPRLQSARYGEFSVLAVQRRGLDAQ